MLLGSNNYTSHATYKKGDWVRLKKDPKVVFQVEEADDHTVLGYTNKGSIAAYTHWYDLSDVELDCPAIPWSYISEIDEMWKTHEKAKPVCTCGAKFTSVPGHHMKWCDLPKDQQK